VVTEHKGGAFEAREAPRGEGWYVIYLGTALPRDDEQRYRGAGWGLTEDEARERADLLNWAHELGAVDEAVEQGEVDGGV